MRALFWLFVGWLVHGLLDHVRRSKEERLAQEMLAQAIRAEVRFRNTTFNLVGARPRTFEEIMDPNWMDLPRSDGTSLDRIIKEIDA